MLDLDSQNRPDFVQLREIFDETFQTLTQNSESVKLPVYETLQPKFRTPDKESGRS